MALRSDFKLFLDEVKNNQRLITHNHELFQIYEGELEKFLLLELQRQLSAKSFEQAKGRIAPINILTKIVDKLSKIYTKGPKRVIVDGTKKDEALLEWYEGHMQVNTKMNIINELFNLHKTVDIEPYVLNGLPRLRGIPADRAMSFSLNTIDPLERTHWGKFMGEMDVMGTMKKVWFVYTDNDFVPVTEDGEIIQDILNNLGNPEGINSFGKIPGVYVNRSFFSLVPPKDSSMMRMTLLIPILLSDLNFAVMMQAFSVMFGIDVDIENLTQSPNAFWNVKSDKTADTKPEIGQIKPQVDIQEVISLVQTELSMWLNSKNIKPGSVGKLDSENLASGISKMIDEMDTFEDRQKQVEFFKDAEQRMWDLIINNMHPTWKAQGLLDTNLEWSSGVKVAIEFPEQRPAVRRDEILKEVAFEIREMLTTRERSIKRLNPDMEQKEVDELMQKIDEDRTVLIPTDEEGDGSKTSKDNNKGPGKA